MGTQHSALGTQHSNPPRGVHLVAVMAALFALPLLITGAQVTTNRVGMAVLDWPTTRGQNMFLYDYFEAPLGVVIEHRHRLFGSALGFASIVLAVWFVAADPRRWMKALGVATLAAVSIQGILGGIRVLRNSTTFAAIHGCTGQAVFALLVALCVLTGRDWATAGDPMCDPDHLRRRSLTTLLLIYAQIVLGATLRHFGANLVLHAVMAVAVWGHVAWLAWRVERLRSDVPSLVAPSRWMAVAVTLQIALGIAAWWVLRPFDGIPRYVTRIQAIFRSGHVVNGAVLLGASLAVTLRAFRHLASPAPATNPQAAVSALAREAVA
jgi:heme a synthase